MLGLSEEIRDRLLVVSSDRTRNNESKLKYRKFSLNRREKKIYCKSHQTLEHVAQKVYGVFILVVFQNTTGHSPEQPAVVALALYRELGLHSLQQSCPNSAILWFFKWFYILHFFSCIYSRLCHYVYELKRQLFLC